jgi:hypothetical protein
MPLKKRPDGKYDTGCPAMYQSPEDMQKKIDKYFATQCKTVILKDEDGRPAKGKNGTLAIQYNPPTVAGLALYLGFADRRSLYDYKYNKPNFSHIINRAITRIEEYAEKQLTTGNSTGAIFWLKNHGWIDTTHQEVTGANGGSISVTQDFDIEKIKQLKEMLGA